MSADADDARAGIVRRAELRVFRAAHLHDVLHRRERLDVVNNRRAHVEPENSREVGRLDARVSALAFERFNQARFLTANVSTRAAMDVDLKIVSFAQNVFAQEILLASFLQARDSRCAHLPAFRRGYIYRQDEHHSRSRR